MAVTGPVGHPEARTTRFRVFDGLLAVALTALAVPQIVHDASSIAFGIVGTLLLTAPLALRRTAPRAVFAITWVIATASAAAGLRLFADVAVLVALYTVATLRPRREVVAAIALAEVTVLVAANQFADGPRWAGFVWVSGLVAAAGALGLYRATRRSYLATLEERADRLERERDQQVALAGASERARIAREMHDIVAHHLTVMVAVSDGAAAAVATAPDRAEQAMRAVAATGRQALTETRQLLGVLRDDPDPGQSGAQRHGSQYRGSQYLGSRYLGSRAPVPDLAGLDELVDGVRAAGLPVGLSVRGRPGLLPHGVQLAVYRLVQEALTNSLKHAGPGAAATVLLRYRDAEVDVEIVDDGGDTAPGSRRDTPEVGRGITGMRERVQAVGGTLDTGPRARGGWRVHAHVGAADGQRA